MTTMERTGRFREKIGAEVKKAVFLHCHCFFQDNRPLPDAFLYSNDEMALGVLSVLQKYDIRVPQDVLLGGFDCVSSAELSDPTLSTIRRDCGEICYQGMQQLLDRICRM